MMGPLLIIAPHPDDELLGAGAIMARAIAHGESVYVLVLTDGGGSDPEADTAALAEQRRRECEAGLKIMTGTQIPVMYLNLPDGAFETRKVDLSPCSEVVTFLTQANPTTILVSDASDAHPDHKAAFGFAARLISMGIGKTLGAMPIGQRIDGQFNDAGFCKIAVADLGKAKRAALEQHESQMGSTPGFILTDGVCKSFCKNEYVRTVYSAEGQAKDQGIVAAEHFNTLFRTSIDPWGYDMEPYEQYRFQKTIDLLEDRSYECGLELGCANGALSKRLSPLCDTLAAVDGSTEALEIARERLSDAAHVRFNHASLPEKTPHGPFDLIVASDVLYYLGVAGIGELMAKLDAAALPNCRLLIANYLGKTDTLVTGEMASEVAIAHLPHWKVIEAQRCDQLRIDVLERL
jgi:LmbE family N-acetylglucosaminyl deacetylase